jgi:hypothetical protein
MSQVYGGPNPQTDDFLFNIPTRIGDDGKAYGSSGALGRANMDYFWRNSKNATPSFGENFKPLGLEGLNQTAFNSALTTLMPKTIHPYNMPSTGIAANPDFDWNTVNIDGMYSPSGGGVNNVNSTVNSTIQQGYSPNSYNSPIGGGVDNVGSTLESLGMQQPAASSGGFDLGGLLGGAAQLGSTWYQNKENIDRLQQLGAQGQAEATRIGQQAVNASTFKPFSVTTGAGTTQTDAQGGFDLGLSPEQAAMQAQLTQQAGGLFGGVTGDIGQASQDIYSQIRGLQAPQEQRDQLRLNEELFSRGRGGISSAQFGGQGAEQFGFNQAQQEAMNQAAFQARKMALGEQEQQLALGKGLLGQAYVPQQQQLDALTAGTNIANIAGTGQRQGATLQSQLGSAGIEALLAASQQAATAQAARDQSYSNLLLGSGSGINATGGLLTGGSGVGGALGSAVGLGDAPTPQWIKDLGNDAKKWLGI